MAYDNPHGFEIIGNPPDLETYPFVPGDEIWPNDAVKIDYTTGKVVRAADDESGHILGIAMHYCLSTASVINVCIDTRAKYRVQAETGFTIDQVDVGLAFGIGNPGDPGAGNDSLISNMELVESGTGTQFVLLGIDAGPEVSGGSKPALGAANCECIVKINLAQWQINYL